MAGFIANLQAKFNQLIASSPGEASRFADFMAVFTRAIEATGEPVYQGKDGNIYGPGGQVNLGGGSTTLAGLSDVGTYDLATNNTSVAAVKTTVSQNTTNITALQAAQSTVSDNAQTGTTYTFALADAGANVDLNNAAAITATIPPHSAVAYPNGTMLYWTQAGAGGVTIAAGAGVTITKRASFSFSTSEQYATGWAYQVSQDNWRVYNG